MNIQNLNTEHYSWDKVESQIHFSFPLDYKELLSKLGVGAINSFFWILSPFTDNSYLNTIARFDAMKKAFDTMKEDELSCLSALQFWDGTAGLFPVAITDNGDEIYWNFNNDDTNIVVIGSRYSQVLEYRMSISEFLYGVLTKSVICPVFPDDCVLENNYFEIYNR